MNKNKKRYYIYLGGRFYTTEAKSEKEAVRNAKRYEMAFFSFIKNHPKDLAISVSETSEPGINYKVID